jgi:hypothetical protein
MIRGSWRDTINRSATPARESTMETDADLGGRLARAVAARDERALVSLLTTPVVFRAVTPRRFFDAETPMGVVDVMLGVWFDASKTVVGLTQVDTDVVGDVERVGYRIEVEIDSQPAVIEQVAFFSQQQGRISELRIVCSGFRPVAATAVPAVRGSR